LIKKRGFRKGKIKTNNFEIESEILINAARLGFLIKVYQYEVFILRAYIVGLILL